MNVGTLYRQPRSIDDHMNFGGKATSRAANGLVGAAFLPAPAPCCWARTIVGVGVIGQCLEKVAPNAARRPTREPRVAVLPTPGPLGTIAPGCAGPEFPDHRLDEQPFAAITATPDAPRTARQQPFNPRKRVVR